MTPAQVKEARVLLNWSRERLSAMSDVPVYAITIYECSGRVPTSIQRPSQVDQLVAVRGAFEAAGVEFVAKTGGARSVELRNKRTRP